MSHTRKRGLIVITAGLVTEYYLPPDVELLVVEVNPDEVHHEPGDEESRADLDVGPSLVTMLSGEDGDPWLLSTGDLRRLLTGWKPPKVQST